MFIHENVLGDLELKTTNENGKRCYVTPDGEKYPSVTTVDRKKKPIKFLLKHLAAAPKFTNSVKII